MGVLFPVGRGGGGTGRGEQEPAVVPHQAGAARHGPIQGGAAHLHPGAALLPRQAVRLFLPLGHLGQVGE